MSEPPVSPVSPVTPVTPVTHEPTKASTPKEGHNEATPKEDTTATLTSSTNNITSPEITTASQSDEQSSISLTLLLASGLRVHLKLDETYLLEHNLKAVESASVLKVFELKQCLFSNWKSEWGIAPAESTNIRLIYYGKILDDDQTLESCKINPGGAQNIIHMSVRPASFEMDDPSKSKSKNAHGSRDSSSGSRCCVIC